LLAFTLLIALGRWCTTLTFTTPFARRLDEFLKNIEADELKKGETKEKSAKFAEGKAQKKVPTWLTELDSLGLVDNEMYSQFIQTAVQKRDLDEARTWAEKARAEGCPLTEEDLRFFIKDALTSNDADFATLWLQQLLTSEDIAPESKKKIGLLAVFLIARQKGFHQARNMLAEGGEEPSHWLRNKARWLLEILRAERGGLAALGARLDDALQAGVEADHGVFRYLLYEALKLPDLAQVSKWFDKAVRHGVVPETPIVNHIIGEVSKDSGFSGAEEWYERATAAGVRPNVYTYKYLIQAAAKSGNPEAPALWFHKSLEAGVAPDVVTFNTLINAAAKAGKLEDAVKWFNMALSMSIRPDMLTYNMVLAAAAQAGDVPAARKWFGLLLEDGFKPDVVSYNSLMKALMKTARTREVEELFWQMKADRIQPDVVTVSTMRWALGRQRVKELLQDAELLSESEVLDWQGGQIASAAA